jgi:tRNA nucleotidyltransferase/poly(A) polymerase
VAPTSLACVSADFRSQGLASRHRARVERAKLLSGKRFLYTLSMSEQAELFEIWFSGFNGRCTEGT